MTLARLLAERAVCRDCGWEVIVRNGKREREERSAGRTSYSVTASSKPLRVASSSGACCCAYHSSGGDDSGIPACCIAKTKV